MRTRLSFWSCAALAARVPRLPRKSGRPKRPELFFPTGAAVAPDESVPVRRERELRAPLRLRLDHRVDLDRGRPDRERVDVDEGRRRAAARRIPITPRRWCATRTPFIKPDAGARIGNFATDIAVQDTGGGTLRLIVPTRGDPSIAWVDWDGTQAVVQRHRARGFALCDDAHRLSYVHNDPDLAPLPDEPFDVFADAPASSR